MKEGFPAQARSQLSNQGFVFEEAKSHGTLFQPQLNHKGAYSWQKPTNIQPVKWMKATKNSARKQTSRKPPPWKPSNWPGGRDSPAFPISVCHRACHQLRHSVGKSLELQGIFFNFWFWGWRVCKCELLSKLIFPACFWYKYIHCYRDYVSQTTDTWQSPVRCIHVIYYIYKKYIYVSIYIYIYIFVCGKNYPHKML